MKESSQNSKRWSKLKISFLTVAAVILLLFAPYIFSRIMSSSRALSVHSSEVDPTAPEREARKTIRIVCYNIAHGRGLATDNWSGGDEVERLTRLNKIADGLREIDADIVVLNEVDFDSSWSHGVNQARYIAEHAGYQFWAEERNLDFRFAMRTGGSVTQSFRNTPSRMPVWCSIPDIHFGKRFSQEKSEDWFAL